MKRMMNSHILRVSRRALENAGRLQCSTAPSSSEPVLVETVENIRLIGINRPEKRNAVNHETAQLLHKAFSEFNSDPSVDAAVFYGEGGTFCAGLDLSEAANFTPEELRKRITDEGPDFRYLGPTALQIKKPVIGAIDGFAVAGGLELALMCDLRIVEDTAIMGILNRRFGVPLTNGGSIRLPKVIGLSRALELILTGKEINAKTAYEWGLANRVVPTGAALGAAVDFAKKIMRYPKQCTLSDRNSVYYGAFEAKSWEDAFKQELESGLKVFDESVEGAKKFAEGKGRHGRDNVQKKGSVM